MINEGNRAAQIARALQVSKSHISYYIKRAKDLEYVNEIVRDTFKVLELTQAGKNFLAKYENSLLDHRPICRAENIRFKAEIISMPSIPVDWHKVEMNHWNQYNSEIDGIKLHVNFGNQPTIEFIPGAVEGDIPDSLLLKLLQDCTDVASNLEERLGMKIGRLELSSKGEWVVYDPVAKAYSKQFGQITIDGIGKVNASKPKRIGELEFYDPRTLADYMAMPGRLHNVEEKQNNFQRQMDIIQNDTREIKNMLKNDKASGRPPVESDRT